MSKRMEFSDAVKILALKRQDTVCAWCGIPLRTKWTPSGKAPGNAHHLRPDLHGGLPVLINCVYLCWAHHQLIGHGNAPYGIDKQGGSTRTHLFLKRDDFPYWKVESKTHGSAWHSR